MTEKDSWIDGLSVVTLKSLLENPNMLMPTSMMRSGPKHAGNYSSYQEKQRMLERPDEYDNPMSAFLGPKLWENTLPDNNDLKFEYMDIEEFLSEHGIANDDNSSHPNQHSSHPSQPHPAVPHHKERHNGQSVPSYPHAPSPSLPHTPITAVTPSLPPVHVQQGLPPVLSNSHHPIGPSTSEEICKKQEDEPSCCSHSLRNNLESKPLLPLKPPEERPMMPSPCHSNSSPPSPSKETPVLTPLEPSPSSSRGPSPVKMDIPFDLTSTDVALATVPGEHIYNPREKKFSEDELKPQPMIKKSRKVFVPDEQKDNKYWERRRKNNVAAKRSRDARRVKENQIVLRASFLEKENNAFKDEMLSLKKDNMSLKKLVASLEKQLKAAKEGK